VTQKKLMFSGMDSQGYEGYIEVALLIARLRIQDCIRYSVLLIHSTRT